MSWARADMCAIFCVSSGSDPKLPNSKKNPKAKKPCTSPCTCKRAQVFFVGSDAKIDMRPSSVWLREKTAKWPWKTHLRVGAKPRRGAGDPQLGGDAAGAVLARRQHALRGGRGRGAPQPLNL